MKPSGIGSFTQLKYSTARPPVCCTMTLLGSFFVLLAVAQAQTACKTQTINADVGEITALALDLRGAGFRRHSSPGTNPEMRSIVRCQGSVEVLSVPNAASAYEGVPLGGIVTIVETEEPLTRASEISQQAVPACSGIFISATQVLSSAHCVYHQRQREDDMPHWMYGDGLEQQSYLYAITGKVSENDDTFEVYALQRACIPQSYIDAENEEATSSQGNDMVVFQTSTAFRGAGEAVAEIGSSIAYNEAREYMLPQYPSDVDDGKRLVIDKNRTPIVYQPLGGGTFFSVDLASWSGSSGGPVIDIASTGTRGRPVVVAILMSSGWTVCDSGIVPVTSGMPIVQELLGASRRVGSGSTGPQDANSLEEMKPSPSPSPSPPPPPAAAQGSPSERPSQSATGSHEPSVQPAHTDGAEAVPEGSSEASAGSQLGMSVLAESSGGVSTSVDSNAATSSSGNSNGNGKDEAGGSDEEVHVPADDGFIALPPPFAFGVA